MSELFLSFFHPFLSLLGIILFLQNLYKENYLFNGVYVSLFFLLIIGGIILFRPFCKKRLYAFEDLGSAVTERILLALIIISLVAGLVTVGFEFPLFFLSLPYGLALFYTYSISVFSALKGNKLSGVIILTNQHIRMLNHFSFFFIGAKVIFLLIIRFMEFPEISTILMILGFSSDVWLLLYLRSYKKNLSLEIERNEKSGAVLFVFTFLFSLLFSRSSSPLDPNLLKRLYYWLISLTKEVPLSGGALELESAAGGPTPAELLLMHEMVERRKADTLFLRQIFQFLEYIFIALIILLILYFIFYPILEPLIFRNRRRRRYKEFYLGLYDKVLAFLKSLRSFFRNTYRSTLQVLISNQKSENESQALRIENTLSSGKKAEQKAVYKLYYKLKQRGARHDPSISDVTVAVNGFFELLSPLLEGRDSDCKSLSLLYNKSFFSNVKLDAREMKDLKKMTLLLLKEL